MKKPSFRLDDIKQYKIEGKIEPKVLAEYKVRLRYAEKGDRTFSWLFCGCQCVNEDCSPHYTYDGDRKGCSHITCDYDNSGC